MDSKKNLYSDGYVVTYEEGDQSLEKVPTVIVRDLDDKIYTIKQGDTLLKIAHFFYNSSRPWHVIADVNNDLIENIFELPIGVDIVIPNLKKIN